MLIKPRSLHTSVPRPPQQSFPTRAKDAAPCAKEARASCHQLEPMLPAVNNQRDGVVPSRNTAGTNRALSWIDVDAHGKHHMDCNRKHGNPLSQIFREIAVLNTTALMERHKTTTKKRSSTATYYSVIISIQQQNYFLLLHVPLTRMRHTNCHKLETSYSRRMPNKK